MRAVEARGQQPRIGNQQRPELGVAQIGIVELGARQIDAAQIGARELCAAQIGAGEIAALKRCAFQIEAVEHRARRDERGERAMGQRFQARADRCR